MLRGDETSFEVRESGGLVRRHKMALRLNPGQPIAALLDSLDALDRCTRCWTRPACCQPAASLLPARCPLPACCPHRDVLQRLRQTAAVHGRALHFSALRLRPALLRVCNRPCEGASGGEESTARARWPHVRS